LLYLFDNYVLDSDRRELRCGFETVAIEPQAFDLLEHLIRQRERVVSRDELIESIWRGRIVSESALSTRINAVRSAIGDSGIGQRLIKTLPRKGLRFVGEVREEEHKAREAAQASAPKEDVSGPDEVRQPDGSLPAGQTFDSPADAPSPAMVAPAKPRRFPGLRANAGAVAAIGLVCFGVMALGYAARSEQTRANLETAARLNQIAKHANITSREDYQAVRALEQWAVDLDPHNAEALTRLTFAIVAGVLNHWSDDMIGDLHVADLSLQEAVHIAPDRMTVHGAQCHILRAMRQYEAAIRVCTESAQSFPKYAFLHKEIGYDRLMLGQLDEALAEFREADQIAPDSRLRWSWTQGIGLIYLMQGQDQKAIELLSRAALEAPNAGHPVAYLASAYALVGREQEARDALDHYVKLWPNTSLSNFGPMVGTAAFNARMERVRAGLRLAGLAEGRETPAEESLTRAQADSAVH